MALEWDQLQRRFDSLSKQLLDQALDAQKRQELQKEHAHLNELLSRNSTVSGLRKSIRESEKQIEETSDEEMQMLFREEVASLNDQLRFAQASLDDLLYPPDPLDDRSVFLEIRAGAGGQEAALFAGDLLKMYSNYSLQKGWRVSLVDENLTEIGGIKEATLHIEGKNVYGHLKNESGVHRVQRVPKTETQGRVHTSTATVAVLPEAKEVDVKINSSDLRIDTYRAGGAGGQHVNKTDSAVRITHIPTGVVVACQDERSQHKNRAKAMKVLQSRLLTAQIEKQEAEMSKNRKEQVGTGMRAEKVRTYNYPQNRVTDHRAEVTLKKLDMVMEGAALEDIIKPLREQEREHRKQLALNR